MRLSWLILSCILLRIVVVAPVLASPSVNLNNDWYFRADPLKSGESQFWFREMPAELVHIQVPHTWNMGKLANFIGTGWYFKHFSSEPGWKTQHVELHFGATFYRSRVWLNGKLVGEHEGGYSEYYFDVSNYLKPENFLAVEIDNELKLDTIPGIPVKNGPESTLPDWWTYGGIVRDVWLTVNEGALIRRQHLRGRPVESSADVNDQIFLENLSPGKKTLELNISLFADDSNSRIVSMKKEVMLEGEVQPVNVSLNFSPVKLWGIDNPYLYRSEVTLRTKDGHLLDTKSDKFGVRTVEIRDRHLYLNGERVRLTGLARHEDSPWEGLAETRGTIMQDFDDLKALHTTLTRPVHYPQNPLIYDYADRKGILLIPEIPMWQFDEGQMLNPKVVALARQQFSDLIEQNFNHPSILAWSTDNESATDTPGGIAYFKNLRKLARQLDPDRYVSFADDRIAFVKDPASNASSIADFIMWNEYFGSWDGPESLLPAAFEKIEHGYPDKLVLVTEFGYPGIYATDRETADKQRAEIIRDRLEQYGKHDWIGGAILWSYQDYHSTHNLRPGQSDSFVDHGVVDKNRQRKPSYFVWQAENSPAHIQLSWNYDEKGVPSGFLARVLRRTEQEIPSYPLLNYSVEWTAFDQNNKTLATGTKALDPMGPGSDLAGKWEPAIGSIVRLEFLLRHPDGSVAQSKRIIWRDPQPGKLTGSELETPRQ